ncbi:MAG TPA: hypothetical protein VJQ52_13020 [Steroidobacteraceae bacterium]|nr:hypothetical protein [Steroidobacteraceae bacterium]
MNTSSALTPRTPRLCCCITTASRAGNTPFWWQYASLDFRFSIIASRIVSGVRKPNRPGLPMFSGMIS